MLLDTASMYFRAFFGVPEIKAPDGTPVNAVRGLLDFISRLVGDYQPTDLVCCWDNDWRPQWRVDLLPSYKAHRVVAERTGAPDIEEVPDPLEVQVPIILEVLEAFGICVRRRRRLRGRRRDRHASPTRRRQPVDIVTGDRDLFQLVDDERRRAGPLHRPRRRQPRAGHQRLGAREVRHRRPAVRRLRDPARRRLRRPARRRRGRREDRRDPAAAVRRHGRHHRRGRTTPTPTWVPARAARSRRPPTTSRSRPRWSPSPATSTSAPPTTRLPARAGATWRGSPSSATNAGASRAPVQRLDRGAARAATA